MLLTRKNSSSNAPAQLGQSVFVDRLQRGLSQALPTLDRRGFLRRSGLGVGVGLAATQLSLVKKPTPLVQVLATAPEKSKSNARCAPTAQ